MVLEELINELLRRFFGTFIQHINSLEDVFNFGILLTNNFEPDKNLSLIKLIFPLFIEHDIL